MTHRNLRKKFMCERARRKEAYIKSDILLLHFDSIIRIFKCLFLKVGLSNQDLYYIFLYYMFM